MGIHLLNRFLRTKNPIGINETHLRSFKNKKVAIDISIYLYRYASQDALTENIFKMCNIFKKYKIRPLFVFDGKISEDKKKTIEKRKLEKREAYKQYNLLKNENSQFSKNKTRLLRDLKRKSTFINIKMIQQVKNLLDSCNMSYITANGEADELCAALAKTKKVYAVLSEDTDMFAFGVPVVLKYFSFVKHTVVKYDTPVLLNTLNLTSNEFLDVCVLSGTDYNKKCDSLFNIYDYMMEYKKCSCETKSCSCSFKSWINNALTQNDYDMTSEIEEIMSSKEHYNINEKKILSEYPFIVIKSGN